MSAAPIARPVIDGVTRLFTLSPSTAPYGPPTKVDIARSCNQTVSIDLVTVGNAASTLVVVSVPAMPGTFCGGRPRGPGGGPGGNGGGLILGRGRVVSPRRLGAPPHVDFKGFGAGGVPAARLYNSLTQTLFTGVVAMT